jgi:glycosyltransferase involved in cell wall biosynthesis
MAPILLGTGEVTLGVISSAKGTGLVRRDYGEIQQWLVPALVNSSNNALPSEAVIGDILHAAKEFQPDIVHVWGTEFFWGLLTGRKHLPYPSLLEIQGLKRPCSRVFAGGLTFRERLACIGVKELLRRTTIFQGKKRFEQWAEIEDEIIAKHSFITAPSPWVEAWVRQVNTTSTIFRTELILRDVFYQSGSWQNPGNCTVFTSAAYSGPFKGLHDAIRAVAVIRKRLPSVKLKIAGGHQNKGMRQGGYIRWINEMIHRYGLSENVQWLGPLSGKEVVRELLSSAVALVPSHCESYCASLAEAMQLGVPVVTAFTGGTAWLGKDDLSALFYPAGDEVMCAHQLGRILSDPELAARLSAQGRDVAAGRNDPSKIGANQLEIYRRVLTGQQVQTPPA